MGLREKGKAIWGFERLRIRVIGVKIQWEEGGIRGEFGRIGALSMSGVWS